ncbi:MAG: GTP-binding protein, partial [Hyphomicrobiales bacterium]|nr:GTP-binding protein [Hyphomicrobiales bacterium]
GTAVIINEFGEIGLDHLFVTAADEGIVELSSGCLCCTIRGELIDTLEDLLRRFDNGRLERLDRVIIETTGLADPAPVLHAVMMHPYLVQRFRLDGVVTVVDAVNGMATIAAHEEAVKQIAVADRVILSKTDLVADAEALAALRAEIASLNPGAAILTGLHGRVDPALIINCGLYDPSRKGPDVARWLNEEAYRGDHAHSHHGHHDNLNRHGADIRAYAFSSEQAIGAAGLEMFLDLLRSSHGPKLLRVKGIVKVAEHPDRPVVIHGVQHVFHPPMTLAEWPDSDHRTRIVFIVRDIAEGYIRRLFDAFSDRPAPDTPDRTAMTDNPLAIPGFSPAKR